MKLVGFPYRGVYKKVYKFEDSLIQVCHVLSQKHSMTLIEAPNVVNNVRKFYSRKFTPNTLKLFEEIPGVTNVIIHDKYLELIDGYSKKEDAIIFKPCPQTLSDFIDMAVNYGLELMWRSGEDIL